MRQTVMPREMAETKYLEEARVFEIPDQTYCDAYRISFQLKGSRYLFYDGMGQAKGACRAERRVHTLTRGDVAVLCPFTIYYSEIREGESDERYVITIRAELLDCILEPEEKQMVLERLCLGVRRMTDEGMERLYEKYLQVEEYGGKQGFLSEKMLAIAVMQLIMLVAEAEEGDVAEGEPVPPQMDSIFLHIWKNYRRNISLDELAKAAGVSKFYFCRTFRELTGATAVEYINHVRLIHAHRLLAGTEMPVEEIARQTGLSSSTNLARVFKKKYGITPSAFRRKIQGGTKTGQQE